MPKVVVSEYEKEKKCEIGPFGNTFTMQIWWSVINFSNYEFTELETKTLGCTTEYSLEVGALATTGTNSNTNVNTTKSEKRSFGQQFSQNSVVEYPLFF